MEYQMRDCIRRKQFYPDDPAPDRDEPHTDERHQWVKMKCDACEREALFKCYTSNGEGHQPTTYSLCEHHADNIVDAGGWRTEYED